MSQADMVNNDEAFGYTRKNYVKGSSVGNTDSWNTAGTTTT